jgi:hypothetical protein
MKLHLFRLAFPLFLLATGLPSAFSQQKILELKQQLEQLQQKAPLEKLFVHTDKDSYLMGDTLWYKTYVMDGTLGGPSTQSGIVYTELHDAFGNSIYLHRKHLLAGSAHGDMILDKTELKPGTYTLRAYTRWLQNFGPEYFFTKTIEIYGDYRQLWSVAVTPMQQQDSEVEVALSTLDKSSIQLQPIKVSIMRGDRVLHSRQLLLNKDGMLRIPLQLPSGTDRSGLEIHLKGELEGEAKFPLQVALPVMSYDIQLLPEGGQWIADRPALFGVKVLDPQGKGASYTGVIEDAAGKEIATFASLRYGMGRVQLPALPVGKYTATLTFHDGATQIVPLPATLTSGILLQAIPPEPQDTHFNLRILRSADRLKEDISITGIAKGQLCYAGLLKPNGNAEQLLRIDKTLFPEGISEFTIINEKGQPLSARRIYIHKGDRKLQMALQTDRESYGLRDSVIVSLQLSDSEGNPVRSHLSVAVTDDSQYQASPFGSDIFNQYFLGSEIKGEIENPGFYFSMEANAAEALDNLLITQGWVSFDQSLLPRFETPAYKAEHYFEISGQVVNTVGKGIPNAKVNLVGIGVPPIALDTLTGTDGRFAFNSALPNFTQMGFVLTGQNRRGGTFNMGIKLDPEAQKPFLPKTSSTIRTPWYVGLDTIRKRQLAHQEEYRINQQYRDSVSSLRRIMLDEVEIPAKKIIRNSRNLNGPGQADLSFNEEDILKNPDRSLYDFLLDSIPGLGMSEHRLYGRSYVYRSKKITFIIDGQNLEEILPDGQNLQLSDLDPKKMLALLSLTSYLKSFPVSDILGTEVLYNSRYNNRYHARFPGVVFETAYIEITTRAGDAGVRQAAGTGYHHDVQFHWPRQFYAPKYASPDSKTGVDLRSTLHWEPMLLTGSDGKGQLRFYTSDQKGSYTIHLQGMDENGNLVAKRHKLSVD